MRWESLQFEQYGIYQDEELGRFTEDPVRLVHFLHAKRSERAVDLGTGNGIIPVYANALYGCPFTGIDIDAAQLRLADLSARRNGQDIPFYELDVSEAPKALGHGRFDLVTMNPPYYARSSAGEDPQRARQRHGDRLDDFLAAASAAEEPAGAQADGADRPRRKSEGGSDRSKKTGKTWHGCFRFRRARLRASLEKGGMPLGTK